MKNDHKLCGVGAVIGAEVWAVLVAALVLSNSVREAIGQNLVFELNEVVSLPRDTFDFVWDVVPHEGGDYYWLQAVNSNVADESWLYWGRTDRLEVDSFLIQGITKNVYGFWAAEDSLGVAICYSTFFEQAGIRVDHTTVSFLSLATSERIGPERSWIGFAHYGIGGQDITYSLGYHLSELILDHKPPLVSRQFSGVVSYEFGYSTGGHGGPPASANTEGGFVITNFMDTTAIVLPCEYCGQASGIRGDSLAVLAIAGSARGTYGGNQWENYYLRGLSADTAIHRVIDIDVSSSTVWQIETTTLSAPHTWATIASVSGGVQGFGVSQNGSFQWFVGGDFLNVAICDVDSANTDAEFLTQDVNSGIFHILDARTGVELGVSNVLPVGTMKVVAGDNESLRRFVYQRGSELRFYSAGDFVKTDDHARNNFSFLLYPVYPNPFNGVTTVAFELPRALPVVYAVHNALGQSVERIDLGVLNGGAQRILLNANGWSSGSYWVRVQAGAEVRGTKIVLVK